MIALRRIRRALLALLAFLPLASRVAHAQTVAAGLAAAALRARVLRDEALRRGDQPYGAVVVQDGRIIGEGVSAVVARGDPDAHAERIAIADAIGRLGAAGVAGAVLVGSSRACAACRAAASAAGIARLYHGDAPDDDGPPGRPR